MIEPLMQAPVVIKVLGSLGLIVLVTSLTKRLMLAMGVGAVALGLWCGHSVLPTETQPGLVGIAAARLASLNLILLLVIVFQVIWLSSQMAATNVMRDLVAAVRARITRRHSMAVLPAVIGWLPMPGGALFSAPLVESCDPDGTVQPALKTRTNYWFRHIWEYWWPIYPGVLLAIDLTGLEIWQFVALELPLSVFAVLGGWFFLLRRIEPETVEANGRPARTDADRGDGPPAQSLLRLITPILVVIGIVAALELGFVVLRHAEIGFLRPQKYVPMMLGIAAAMFVLNRQRPLSLDGWKEILFAPRTLRLVALVALVRVFGAFIDARLPGGELLVKRMQTEFAAWEIPVLLIVILIPFVSGVSTGLAVGFVGASFPIVLSLVPADAPLGELLATTVLAYAAGHSGMMLSPVHVCLIVTNEHFRTRLLASLYGLLGPAVVMIAGGLVMHVLVGWLVPW